MLMFNWLSSACIVQAAHSDFLNEKTTISMPYHEISQRPQLGPQTNLKLVDHVLELDDGLLEVVLGLELDRRLRLGRASGL